MKTIKLKYSIARGGTLTPQRDEVNPGYGNGCITIAVTGLPDDATYTDALLVAESVMRPEWLDNVDASQAGKNLYRAENLTESQLASAPVLYLINQRAIDGAPGEWRREYSESGMFKGWVRK